MLECCIINMILYFVNCYIGERMKKVDSTVLKETRYIALCVIIFSTLMQAVFLVIGKWDYTVLLGNLLTAAASVLNFFLLGLTVQKAVEKEEKEAKNTIKLSQIYRTLFLFVVLVIGIVFSCFNTWAVIIPVFFPRLAIVFRTLFNKKKF